MLKAIKICIYPTIEQVDFINKHLGGQLGRIPQNVGLQGGMVRKTVGFHWQVLPVLEKMQPLWLYLQGIDTEGQTVGLSRMRLFDRPWLQRCVEHIGGGRKDNRAEFARIDACGLPNYRWQGGVSAPKK